VPSSHDALVRHTFGQIEHARGLLRSIVPQELAALIEWDSLERLDGTFIDGQLAERQTDLLYGARVAGRRALLYLLLEHQSSNDRFMPLRMLVYLTRIWERCRNDAPQALLPPILPIVLHHSQRGWTAPTSLRELIDADPTLTAALGELMPALRFHLLDLTRHDDRALHAWLATDLGKLVALCLKHVSYEPEPELAARMAEWLDLIARITRAPSGVAALDVVARYILEVSELTAGDLRSVLESGLTSHEVEAVMTGAEKLREEGRSQGRAEGRVEGKAEVVLKLLTLRFGVLPASIEARVRAASVHELDRFAERVLSAGSLDDVLR
jgi:hypothetical protein